MTKGEAMEVAENWNDLDLEIPENHERYIQAWQLLIDTGVCWQLQGWFGRTAMMMIELGHCNPPKEK